MLITGNVLQLQSLISTVIQFQLSFPGLQRGRWRTSVLLWISAVTGVTASASLPWGRCLSSLLPPFVRALSAQPGANRLSFMFYQPYYRPKALDKDRAASFQMSCSDQSAALQGARKEEGLDQLLL